MNHTATNTEMKSESSQVSSLNPPILGDHTQQIDNDHVKVITARVQKLVEKTKSLEKENRRLQEEINTMKREGIKRYANLNKTWHDKVNKVTLERNVLKKRKDDMKAQIEEAL